MEGKTIKIGEFAARYGVTDRHARRLAAACEADLVGHIEKRGNAGTWIDEYAETYLRDKLRNPLEILPAPPEEADPAELQRELNEMTRKWAEAEQRASLGVAAAARLEAAEQRVLLLEDVHTEAMSRREAEHKSEVAKLEAEHRADVAEIKAAYAGQIGALEGTNRILAENVEKAGEQLQEANERALRAEAGKKAAEDLLAKILDKQAELTSAKWPWQRSKILRELKDLQAQVGNE